LWPPEVLDIVLARMGAYDEPAAHADESGGKAEDTPEARNGGPLYAPSLRRLGAAPCHACSGRCSDGVAVSTADFVQPDGSVMLEAEWRSHVVSTLARSAIVAAAAGGGGFAVAAWPKAGLDDVQATELAVAPASVSFSDCSDEVDEYEGAYSDAYDD
jgi:hypothetical protein